MTEAASDDFPGVARAAAMDERRGGLPGEALSRLSGLTSKLTAPILRASVFAQLVALVLLSLAAALSINVAIVFLLPPPAPENYPLGEVVAAFKANGAAVHTGNDLSISARLRPTPPAYPHGGPGFRESVLARSVADALGVDAEKTRVVLIGRPPPGAMHHRHRLFEVEGRLRPPPFAGRLPPRGVLPPSTEEEIPAPFVAAIQQANGEWLTVRVADSGLLNVWQQRVLLCFALSALCLIPIVYLFARGLARPITAFANAAERLGRDPGAPPVDIRGPAEVETAAFAFNEMQERLRRYVADRTAMVGAVAHDMRTPLTRVRFRIEAAPEPMRSKIIADIEQMETMISSAMAFVRDASDPVERRKLELVSLVESIVDEMAETGLDVTAEASPAVVIDRKSVV